MGLHGATAAGLDGGVLGHRKPQLITGLGLLARIGALHQEDAAGIAVGELAALAKDQVQQGAQIAGAAQGGGNIQHLHQGLVDQLLSTFRSHTRPRS